MLRIFAVNFGAKLLIVAVSLVSIPIYVRYIGIGSYGIIGIYSSLTTLAGVFDIAFSNTISRELARREAAAFRPEEIGAVFRTLELFAWGVAAALGCLVIAGAAPLVNYWIGPHKYGDQDVIAAVRLMALLLLFQAPLSFYSGSLYGMHRHGLINVISVMSAVLAALSSIGALVFIKPTVGTFFVAQLVARIATVAAMALGAYILLVRNVPVSCLKANRSTWQQLWRFAMGVNGLSVLNLIGAQADMIVLSRLLGSSPFGYYTLARAVGQSLVTLAAPAYQSAFPALARLVATGDRAALAAAFHRSCQLLALILLPPAVVICVFSGEVLALWTHNAQLVANTSLTLRLFAAGCLLNGLGYLINALQMANGAVRLMMGLGALFVCLIVPALLVVAPTFAAAGASMVWLGVNLVVFVAGAIITLRRYLPGELLRWATLDNLLPALATLSVVVAVKLFEAGPDGSAAAAASLFVAAFAAEAASALTLAEGRALIRTTLGRMGLLLGKS